MLQLWYKILLFLRCLYAWIWAMSILLINESRNHADTQHELLTAANDESDSEPNHPHRRKAKITIQVDGWDFAWHEQIEMHIQWFPFEYIALRHGFFLEKSVSAAIIIFSMWFCYIFLHELIRSSHTALFAVLLTALILLQQPTRKATMTPFMLSAARWRSSWQSWGR